MDWREKTVSMNQVKKDEFDLAMTHITVSENRILVETQEDTVWEQIKRDFGDDVLLREIYWEEVEELAWDTDWVYPYITVFIAPESGSVAEDTDLTLQRRIFFEQDEIQEMATVFKTIRNYWYAYRQHGVVLDEARGSSQPEEIDGETVELEEALKEQAAEAETTGTQNEDTAKDAKHDTSGASEDADETGDESQDTEDGDEDDLDEVVERFMDE